MDHSSLTTKYDGIGQLINADCSVATEDRGYFYDSAWNLDRRTNNGATQVFQVDDKNQLTDAMGQALTFDDNGNTLTASNGCNVLVYDDENRLIQWVFYQNGSSQPGNGDKRTDFVYDGQSRLRKRLEFSWVQPQATNPPPEEEISVELRAQESQSPGVSNYWRAEAEVRYIYDGNRVIQERDTNNVPTLSYTRGTDLSGSLEGAGGIGGLLARSTNYSGGNWSSHAYYHADGNGNITYLVSSIQGQAASYRYGPFGNMVSQSGFLADANVYRFSSKELHVNSGLYYYLYRFYSPNWQRWVNRDPVEEDGGVNLYAFVENDPQNFLDDYGYEKKKPDSNPPSKRAHGADKRRPKLKPRPPPPPEAPPRIPPGSLPKPPPGQPMPPPKDWCPPRPRPCRVGGFGMAFFFALDALCKEVPDPVFPEGGNCPRGTCAEKRHFLWIEFYVCVPCS